jgi:cellulose synthase/poly-beta-1,6-N-acetylglucosamine synthase-like glycosyltransferase
MLSEFQPFEGIGFVLFIALGGLLLIQLLFYWVVFIRLAIHKPSKLHKETKGVSLVICSRDGHNYLKENLPYILDQDHPNFEVVVVNNNSEDDSAYLLARMAEQDPKLQVVEMKQNLNFFSGKKFPLSIGIKSAHNDIILLTDADCRPLTRKWLSYMQQSFDDSAEIVLGYSPYKRSKGFLDKLIRFDTAHIAVQYLSYALAGIPYMGVGRNMAYTKSLFYESQGFISHYNISSGDDDLFVNRVANRKNTRVMIDPDSFTISEPKKTFRNWIIQKRRHLSTGKFYRWKHKLLLGTYNISIALFYLLFIYLLAVNYNIILVLALFSLRFLSQLFIFRKCLNRLREKGLWLLIPILEIFMLLLNTTISITSLFSKPVRWK